MSKLLLRKKNHLSPCSQILFNLLLNFLFFLFQVSISKSIGSWNGNGTKLNRWEHINTVIDEVQYRGNTSAYSRAWAIYQPFQARGNLGAPYFNIFFFTSWQFSTIVSESQSMLYENYGIKYPKDNIDGWCHWRVEIFDLNCCGFISTPDVVMPRVPYMIACHNIWILKI